MSEQKWTPEPWAASTLAEFAPHRILPVDAFGGVRSDGPIGDVWSDHNRARIVQCVNACAGIPDPAAEIARLRGLEAENARLRSELAALSPPQPVAGWRDRCVVEQAEDGMWDVHSPDRRWWWDGSEWVLYIADLDEWEHSTGRFGGEATARAALAACPTPPPGVTP